MTNYRDRYEIDEEGNRFVFTVEMQRRLAEAGFPPEVAYLDEIDLEPQAIEEDDEEPVSAPPREERSQPSRQQEDVTGPDSIQIDPMSGKYIGRVKWYNARKGFGFILRGANEEIFFHRSAAVGDPEALSDGLWVLYDVEETKKGPEATDIEAYDDQDEM